MKFSKIIGVGSYLPKKILTNKDLEKSLDTTDEWITSRTGIKERHIADIDELTSDLAFEAARNAISNSSISPKDIDLIIGGHTHTFLNKPVVIDNVVGEKVIVNQVGCHGLFLGKIDFYFDSFKNKKYEGVSIEV